MSRSALYQGSMDGLCGLYSIVNAFNVVLSDTEGYDENDFCNELFQFCVKQLDYEIGLKTAILSGIKFTALRNVVSACVDYIEKNYNLEVGVELLDVKKNITGIKNDVQNFLKSKHGCVIIGIKEPCLHWSVVDRVSESGKTWFLSDSDFFGNIRTKKLSSADKTNGVKDTLIDSDELLGLYLVLEEDDEDD